MKTLQADDQGYHYRARTWTSEWRHGAFTRRSIWLAAVAAARSDRVCESCANPADSLSGAGLVSVAVGRSQAQCLIAVTGQELGATRADVVERRHPIIASFEPGEDWFYDYEKRGMIKRGTRDPDLS